MSRRAIAGLSRGGYGAVKAALRRPDLFSAASSLTGVLVEQRWEDLESAPWIARFTLKRVFGKRIDDNSFARNDVYRMLDQVPAARRPALRVRCGSEDAYRLFVPARLVAIVVIVAAARLVIADTLAAFLGAVAPHTRFFLPLALIGKDPEIVIGELKVIFLLHPVSVEMGVVRQLSVLVEQLLSVAARPAVDPVDWLTALLTVITAAAPTVVTTIVVIQGYVLKKSQVPRDPSPPANCLSLPTTSIHARGSDICRRSGAEPRLIANAGVGTGRRESHPSSRFTRDLGRVTAKAK